MDAASSAADGVRSVEAAPVKDRFTALDTLALAREIRAIVGGRLDKAFTAAPAGTALLFRVPGSGRRELTLLSGRYAFLRRSAGEHASDLDPLAKEIRRLLSGAQLTEVPDPAGERYLELMFRRPDVDGPLILAVELFGTGNLVVARDGTLAAVEHARRWAHRSVRVGSVYQRPPSRMNPFTATPSALEASLRESRTDRVSTLAARLGLGGSLSEEILARASLAPEVPAPTDAAEAARRIADAVAELLREVGELPAGFLYRREDVPVDVGPVPLRRWTGVVGVEVVETLTFSEAAERYFTSLPPPETPLPSTADEARQELERLREQQERAVDSLRSTVEGLQRQGELILAHFAEVEQALQAAEGAAAEEALDVQIEGETIPVPLGRPVREAAGRFFDEAKRLKAKLAGAEAALAQTEAKRRLASEVRATSALRRGEPGVERRKAHWFERYRWFFTSDGWLVIGGRDAASNDLLVRRYLKPGDIYVHADIHGAPSVILKHPVSGAAGLPSEASLREAGQWGFCLSKAWRAGLASGTAFWVTPDQVSKAGASGEFVPRGAFVIHGTKNFLRDLPAELAIGPSRVEGEELWTVAPPSALATQGAVRALLTPGEERDRPSREVDLARELGLSRDRLQSLLPAGGFTARRV